MSWSAGTTAPIPKSQISSITTKVDLDGEDQEQLNRALLAAASLAEVIATDQHYVSVTIGGNHRGISISVSAEGIPDALDKTPYDDADLALPDDRTAKRAERDPADPYEGTDAATLADETEGVPV